MVLFAWDRHLMPLSPERAGLDQMEGLGDFPKLRACLKHTGASLTMCREDGRSVLGYIRLGEDDVESEDQRCALWPWLPR